MPAKFRRRDAGVMPEKVAEIKFAGKIQLPGDVLHRQSFVREQEPRLIETRALDVFMHRALAGFLKRRAQPGITDFANRREFLRFPIAQWICGNGVEHAHDRFGQFGVRRIQKIPRHEQFAEHRRDDDVNLPFPAERFAAHKPEQFTLRPLDEAEIVHGEFGIFLAANFLVPKFQTLARQNENR